MTYKTYELAERRVWSLVHTIGVWPGIMRCEGGWRLTYDPAISLTDLNSHGYLG